MFGTTFTNNMERQQKIGNKAGSNCGSSSGDMQLPNFPGRKLYGLEEL
jgi:hypothetical protein